MSEKMILQIRLFGKAFRALVATVWPRSLMDVRVPTEITRCRKCFLAETAFVRLFLGEEETNRLSSFDLLVLSCGSSDGNTDSNWQ